MNRNLSRRDLSLLAPALAAVAARAQQPKPALLDSKIYHDKQIPYTGNDNKKGRRFLDGVTHTGYHIEVHESIVGPGLQTHPAHRHEHEELVIVMEGALEAHIEDRIEAAEAGSVICFGSNQLHNGRNVGATPCRYYVLELRASA